MLTRRAKGYSSSCSQTVSLSRAISSQFILKVCVAAEDRKNRRNYRRPFATCRNDLPSVIKWKLNLWLVCPCVTQSDCAVYELFSIMVHSGGASGGHYYAYIKYAYLIKSTLHHCLV